MENTITIFGILVLAISAGLWIAFAVYRDRFPLLKLLRPADPTPKCCWGLIDLFVIFFILVFVSSIGLLITTAMSATPDADASVGQESDDDGEDLGDADRSEDEPDRDESESELEDPTSESSVAAPTESAIASASRTAIHAIAQLVALGMMIAWILIRHRTSPETIGVRRGDVVRDIAAGAFASVMILPPVIAIHVGLTEIVEYEHPTRTQVLSHQTAIVYLAAFLSAGIAAPFVEEYLYRVFILGWIWRGLSLAVSRRSATGRDQAPRSQTSGHQIGMLLLLGGVTEETDAKDDQKATGRKKGRSRSAEKDKMDAQESPWWPAWIAVGISSGLFGLAHSGQGAAPIPLFLFSLAVGYLYVRTQRVIPAITVHLILNFISLTLLIFAESA